MPPFCIVMLLHLEIMLEFSLLKYTLIESKGAIMKYPELRRSRNIIKKLSSTPGGPVQKQN